MTDPKRLTAEQIEEIHFRLNGSSAGPWSPDYKFANEGGGRFWGNRMLQAIAALEAELAQVRGELVARKAIDAGATPEAMRLLDELDNSIHATEAERDTLRLECERLRSVLLTIAETAHGYGSDCLCNGCRAKAALEKEGG